MSRESEAYQGAEPVIYVDVGFSASRLFAAVERVEVLRMRIDTRQ